MSSDEKQPPILADRFFDEFEQEGAALLTLLKWFITRNCGERCSTVEEDCLTCEMWKMHDRMTEILK